MEPNRGGRWSRNESSSKEAADTTTSLVPQKSLYLFFAHNRLLSNKSYSLCKINLNDLQEHDAEPRPLSPVVELEGNDVYPTGMGCALLGSKLYILGGELINLKVLPKNDWEIFPRHVYQVDTTISNPSIHKMDIELNTGKPAPCVFAAAGKIYALGTKTCDNLPFEQTLCAKPFLSTIKLFECFDPNNNRWEVLTYPSVSDIIRWEGCNVLDLRGEVLLLGRDGPCTMVVLLFNLQDQNWIVYDYSHYPFDHGMIYMALSSQEAGSRLHLYGIYSNDAPVKSNLDIFSHHSYIPSSRFEDKYRLVPLSSVDKSIDIFRETPYIHYTKRLLRYLGDHHFCYINSGVLPDPNGHDLDGYTTYDECSRGITITLFKEISHDDNIDGNSTSKSGGEELRHSFQAKILHSQEYLIKSHVPNMARLVECFVVVNPEPRAAAPVKKASPTAKLAKVVESDDLKDERSSDDEKAKKRKRVHKIRAMEAEAVPYKNVNNELVQKVEVLETKLKETEMELQKVLAEKKLVEGKFDKVTQEYRDHLDTMDAVVGHFKEIVESGKDNLVFKNKSLEPNSEMAGSQEPLG